MKTNKKYLDKLANKNNFTFKDLKFFRESVNKQKYDIIYKMYTSEKDGD